MSYDPTEENLVGLEPDVQECAIYLINAYRAAGYPAIIISGLRSPAEQALLIQQGRTTATRSWHLQGRAIDIGFLGHAPAPYPWLAAAAPLWRAMGGRWGGDFSTPDPNHFDGGSPTL